MVEGKFDVLFDLIFLKQLLTPVFPWETLIVGNINNTVIRDMQIHTDVEEGNWEAKEVPSLYCSLEVGFFIDPASDS